MYFYCNHLPLSNRHGFGLELVEHEVLLRLTGGHFVQDPLVNIEIIR